MAADTPQARTLRRAVEISGGEVQLAAALQVTAEELKSWLSGKTAPPTKVYLAALDIVAHRPPPKS